MRKIILFLLLFTTISLNAQTIYSEDFTNQEDQGAVGPDNMIDVTTVNWDVNVDNVVLSATSDWFKVTNGIFEARDVDGPQDGGSNIGAIWTSPTIDLTGYNEISISMDISESGDHETSDYVRASYSLDGATPIEFGYATDDFTSTVFSVMSLNGTSLIITVEMDNNAGTEYLRMDNILVTGALVGGDTQVSLTETSTMIDEDAGTINICASIVNESATVATTVDLELDNASTTTNGDDYTSITFPQTLTFPAGSTVDQCLSIVITDDINEEPEENIILNLVNPTGGLNATLGTNIQHTVTISANDVPLPSIDDIRINEVDADTPGTDVAEFVELFGTPTYSLDSLVLVFYNGSDDKSYKSIDLDGFALDANGYFILGGPGAPGNPEVTLGGTQDQIQNGADAVALFLGDDTDFPNDTPISTTTLIDVLVYGVNDADDTGLLNGFNELEQIDENINGDSENQSIQRGSWFVTTPSPRGENILPVKLTSFKVKTKGGSNILQWTTATEINNDFFSIERSNNGRDFDQIGKVEGNGNSYGSIDYRFLDNNPETGANYYRLKQIDFDGRYEYSDILRAENTKSRISIYPTTSSDYITIDMDEQQVASVIVFNEIGQTIKDMTITEMKTRIDISDVPNGMYFVQVNAQSGKEIKKIIKQ